MQNLLASEDAYAQAFTAGLESLLQSDQPGAFILVLANASYDQTLFERLREPLRQRFDFWQERLADSPGDFAADDISVFRQLFDSGFDWVEASRFTTAGIWQLQYNRMRTLRPARNAGKAISSNHQPFDAAAFNFNRSFLKQEEFWSGQLQDRSLRLLYNKFPFARMHGLLLVDSELEKPQWLETGDHRFIWQFVENASEHLPIGVAYNSLGAYASVNHQHFQSWVSAKKYPVELGAWTHNGGRQSYPLMCRKYYDPADSWSEIERLQQASRAFNLLYRGGVVYVMERAFQGSYPSPVWSGGFAWSEVAGVFALADAQQMSTLQETDITAALQQLQRSP